MSNIVDQLISSLSENRSNDDDVNPYIQTHMLQQFDMQAIEQTFKVGDWVTPKKNGHVKGNGKPHHVVAVWPSVQLQVIDVCRPVQCYNMLVTECKRADEVLIYAAMSNDYELYDGLIYSDEEV